MYQTRPLKGSLFQTIALTISTPQKANKDKHAGNRGFWFHGPHLQNGKPLFCRQTAETGLLMEEIHPTCMFWVYGDCFFFPLIFEGFYAWWGSLSGFHVHSCSRTHNNLGSVSSPFCFPFRLYFAHILTKNILTEHLWCRSFDWWNSNWMVGPFGFTPNWLNATSLSNAAQFGASEHLLIVTGFL